jgi:hypothetical protein
VAPVRNGVEVYLIAQAPEEGSTPAETGEPGQPLPYQQATQATQEGLRQAYLRDCAGRRILRTLQREPKTPLNRIRFLERKLAAMPRLVQGHRLVSRLVDQYRGGRISRQQMMGALRGLLRAFPELIEFPFPRGYFVSSLANELANARCELSQARWEFFSAQRTGRVPGRLVPR